MVPILLFPIKLLWGYTPFFKHTQMIPNEDKHWLVVWIPLKILVSWDYYYQYMENMFQTTNQNIYFPPCPTNIHHRRIQPFTKFRPVWLTPLLLGKFQLLEINHGMGDKNRWMWVNWSIYQTIHPKSAKYQTQKRTKITKFGNWSVLWPLLHKLVYNHISL